MEKQRAILERLERIDGLRGGGRAGRVLLDEVRALLADAEDWVRGRTMPPDAEDAIERVKRHSQRARAQPSRRA